MYDENDCNHGPDGSGCGSYERETGLCRREELKYMVYALLAIFALVGIFLWPSSRREAKAEPYLIEASARIKQAVYWRAEGEFTTARDELNKAAESLKAAQGVVGKNKRYQEIEAATALIARVEDLSREEVGNVWKKIKDKKTKFLELPR
ncbi:MAG: hypothetical protein V1867_06540 [Candidatus Falkowbacteria bacterium]